MSQVVGEKEFKNVIKSLDNFAETLSDEQEKKFRVLIKDLLCFIVSSDKYGIEAFNRSWR